MEDRCDCNYISLSSYNPEYAFPEAVRLIAESAGSEREDELFYDYLLSQAPSPEDAQFITAIRDDERKHNQIGRASCWEIVLITVVAG